MAQTTVALVAIEPNVLRLDTVQLDKLRPDEALVEIHAVGICHAEVSCLNGTIPVRFPNVFGHEGSYYSAPNAV
jgi:Zn-dependent alcohol dehydrogenase